MPLHTMKLPASKPVKPGTELPAADTSAESDVWRMTPLGAGQEVGRSCHLLEFKGKKILLDCGIHPGLNGFAGLPFIDSCDPSKVDLMLITHFHLDHAGGLPWFLQKTPFKGKVFMTHPTKSIYRMLLSDYIKVSNISNHSTNENQIFSEQDLEASMNRIETIDYHEEKEVAGIKFWCYQAGHVLGAAMFMIEIAGVRVLYTGDYSREEDRHLMAAEIPALTPDVLIIESTYGIHLHETREVRENRFTSTVKKIVSRGGRCLIPVFALGRAQELLLILDDYWAAHPEIQEIPIYYASALAKKCMTVYQTFSGAMNANIQNLWNTRNPFQFRHISNLKGMEHFDDVGPSVVMASPGMMQSGLSRELFETWCTDRRNGCIIAGYCVEGTLAKHVLSQPDEITTLDERKNLPLKMSVDYISFSAHADYKQTSEFVRAMKPPHVVLVHGEQNEMNRLKMALKREYEDDAEIEIHNPKNLESVQLCFRGEKKAKVLGSLAEPKKKQGEHISGVLVRRNFNYHIMSAEDLPEQTNMSTSTITQRSSIHFTAPFRALRYHLEQLADQVTELDLATIATADGFDENKALLVFNSIYVMKRDNVVYVEWKANTANNIYAESVMAIVLRVESDPQTREVTNLVMRGNVKDHFMQSFKPLLKEMLAGKYGKDCLEESSADADLFTLMVGVKEVKFNMKTRVVKCEKDPMLREQISNEIKMLYKSVMPVASLHAN